MPDTELALVVLETRAVIVLTEELDAKEVEDISVELELAVSTREV